MKENDKKHAISSLLSRGVEQIIDEEKLQALLEGKKKLRVKHGIDPTGKGIHIGRAVVLWKLKAFQELGHKIVLIIGDMTAQIGDPSDKLEKRPFLTPKDVKENLKGYLGQIGKIIDIRKVEVRHNSEWLGKLKLQEISELAEIFSVQQMLARRNFSDRIKKQEEISIRELLYPLMQGYDSVAVRSDVEIGGRDQLFNLLAGRKIQERYGQKPQQIMTTAMLDGIDGRKMSTSWGNVIRIEDSAEEQYGKVMSIRDEMIPSYLLLATDIPRRNIHEYEDQIKKGLNPKKIKEILAYAVVRRYYGNEKAKKAQESFSQLFSRKETRGDLPFISLVSKDVNVLELVIQSKKVKSKNEARRLVEQGGLQINGQKRTFSLERFRLSSGDTIKIGKYGFFRVK